MRNEFKMKLGCALVCLLGFACATGQADITWTGDGDGISFRNSAANWSPNTVRPGIGENILLPTNATTTTLLMNDDRDYNNFIVDGVGVLNSVFEVQTNNTNNRDGASGTVGSINGGILRITGQEFILGRGAGTTSLVGTVDFRGADVIDFRQNDADINGGGRLILDNGTTMLADSANDVDGTYSMNFTIRIDASETAEIQIDDGGSGAQDDRRVTFENVHMGAGSTLTWDQNREGASRINFTLDGAAIANVDTNHNSDHSAYVGDIKSTTAVSTLTLNHTRSNGNEGTVLFVGELDPGTSPGVLNIDASVFVEGMAASATNLVQLSDTASYLWEVGATADVVNVTGDLSIEDGFGLSVNALLGATSGTYDLFTYTGVFTGDLALMQTNAVNPDGMLTINSIVDTGSAIQIDITTNDFVIPEPATAGLFGLAAVLGLRRRRLS